MGCNGSCGGWMGCDDDGDDDDGDDDDGDGGGGGLGSSGRKGSMPRPMDWRLDPRLVIDA